MIQDACCVFFRLLLLSLHGAYDIAPKRRTAILKRRVMTSLFQIVKKVVSNFTPCATVRYLKENSS